MFQCLYAVAFISLSRFPMAINRSQTRSETLHGLGIQLHKSSCGVAELHLSFDKGRFPECD